MDTDEMLDWTEKAVKQIHARGEQVRPVLWLSWDQNLTGLFITTKVHPVDVSAVVLGFIGAAYDYDWIGLTVEAWIKEMHLEEGDLPPDTENWERGRLEREAVTNPDVRTALITVVINAKDISQSKMRTNVDRGDPLNPDWQVENFEGPMEGWIYEGLTKGLRRAREGQPPPAVPIEQWVDVLGGLGLVDAAMVSGPVIHEPEHN